MTRPVGVEKVSTNELISMAVQGVLSHSLATPFWMSIVSGQISFSSLRFRRNFWVLL